MFASNQRYACMYLTFILPSGVFLAPKGFPFNATRILERIQKIPSVNLSEILSGTIWQKRKIISFNGLSYKNKKPLGAKKTPFYATDKNEQTYLIIIQLWENYA